MGNMSYCRFRNTLAALSDCYDSWDEPIESDEEIDAMARIIGLCKAILEDYGNDQSLQYPNEDRIMIVRKEWKRSKHGGLTVHMYHGWFLFGLIPLYIRRYGCH